MCSRGFAFSRSGSMDVLASRYSMFSGSKFGEVSSLSGAKIEEEGWALCRCF